MSSLVRALPSTTELAGRAESDFVAIAHAIREYGAEELRHYTTIQQVMDAHAKLAAIQEYIRRAVADVDVQLAAQNDLTELRLRQERRAGEMLAGMEKSEGGRPRETGCSAQPVFTPTLASLGIEKTRAHRWQLEASVPEEDFDRHVRAVRDSGRELTGAGLLKLAKQIAAQTTEQEEATDPDYGCRVVADLADLISEGERFATVYADPPWRYENQGTRAATDNHYLTMSVEEIAALPVRGVADENAHLHLWTTNAFLFDAKTVMEAWGFEYKSVFVWCKPQMGIGNYWRVSHEFLLLGVRGRQPFRDRGQMSWAEYERGEHSAKPEGVRQKVEAVSPGPYLEMFGRCAVPGWTVFGNQVARRHLFARES
jgi:N6-adenosine-specific RNA methylase IME4